jgi:hypothetical protein
MNWLRRYLRNLLDSGRVELASGSERLVSERIHVEVDTALNGYVIIVTKHQKHDNRKSSPTHHEPIRELWVCKTKEGLDETIRAAMVSIKLKGD